jgi:hypothetical protein
MVFKNVLFNPNLTPRLAIYRTIAPAERDPIAVPPCGGAGGLYGCQALTEAARNL